MLNKVKYEVASRSVEKYQDGAECHSVNLLYRGDGASWHEKNHGLVLGIPADSDIAPGDHILVTVEKLEKDDGDISPSSEISEAITWRIGDFACTQEDHKTGVITAMTFDQYEPWVHLVYNGGEYLRTALKNLRKPIRGFLDPPMTD